MIKIYGTHMTIYLEREKIKVLGLVGPMGKRGCLSTFMVHLGLVGMRVVLPSYDDPFGWPMVLYVLLSPSVLMVGAFGMLTFILWFLFLDHWYFMVFTFGPLLPYPKSTLFYVFIFWTIRQINFMVLFCIKTLNHFIYGFYFTIGTLVPILSQPHCILITP